MAKLKASEEVALIKRDHGKSKAYPGLWQIGDGGHHLFFWPDSDAGVKAAEARGLLVDVELLRAGPELGSAHAEAVIQRASASPDMEAALIDLVRLWDRSSAVWRAGNPALGLVVTDARRALALSGAL